MIKRGQIYFIRSNREEQVSTVSTDRVGELIRECRLDSRGMV